jgi:inosine/xanthosine triphosphate pyrophosphatase family protein
MELIKSSRFLEEYNSWNEKILAINNTEKKQEMQRLLQQLVNEIKKIDQLQMNMSQRLVVDTSTDSRQSITELRKKINLKLKELQAAGFID